MASKLPDAGGARSTGTFSTMRKAQGAGKGGLGPMAQQASTGGAGKGGGNPASGLSGRLAGQARTALDWANDAAAGRRAALGQVEGRLGEVDQLFAGREPAYQQAHDLALQKGTREADEWNRGQEQQQRWGMLGRGLTGGSADVETQSRQRRALGDLMGSVRAGARGAERQMREGDLGLRGQMRRGILAGLPWQGAQQYRPLLMGLPDFQGANRRHTDRMLGTLAQGGLFT